MPFGQRAATPCGGAGPYEKAEPVTEALLNVEDLRVTLREYFRAIIS